MSIIVIPSGFINIIYFEFDENNPYIVNSLYLYMFILVVISYKYTYPYVPTKIYFSFGDNAIYLKHSS